MEDRGWKMGNSVSILHLQSSIFFDLRVSVALWLNRIPCDELTDGGAVITIPRYEGRSRSRLVDRNARWRARPAGDVQAFSRGDSLHAAASARFRCGANRGAGDPDFVSEPDSRRARALQILSPAVPSGCVPSRPARLRSDSQQQPCRGQRGPETCGERARLLLPYSDALHLGHAVRLLPLR